MEKEVLVRRLWFWLLARLPGVRSYVEVVVAAFRRLEVGMLQVIRQNELNAYSISHLGLAAGLFWCSVSLDWEPCGLDGGGAQCVFM